MRIAILDPAAGISGDMTLGALLSLGVPPAWLEALPGRLGFAEVGVVTRDAMRGGVNCKQVEFTIPEQPHGRHVGELVGLVERTPVSDAVKERAVRAFRLIGEAVPGNLAQTGALRAQLTVAGYRWTSAVSIFIGIKCASAVMLAMAGVWATVTFRPEADIAFAFLPAVCGLGAPPVRKRVTFPGAARGS